MPENKDEGKDENKVKGGKARAKALSKEQRASIAKRAAEARWSAELPQASHEGNVKIGNIEIYSAVLPNGKRLLSQGQFLSAIGRSSRPKAGTGVLSSLDGLPTFLSADQLKPFITDDLRLSTTPIFFSTKEGRRTVGYDAEILPKVCEVYLKLRDSYLKDKKVIPKAYAHIIEACDLLVRGLAHVGIIALVDEATGYQYDRARKALEEILEQFISKELLKWVKTFPDEFYQHIFRLKGMKLSDVPNKKPRWIGKLTNDIVYERLAPGVLDQLRKVTPRDATGRLKHKYFQKLTEDIGNPRLREHLAAEIALMRIFDDGEWNQFYKALNKSLPKQTSLPLFDKLDNGAAEEE